MHSAAQTRALAHRPAFSADRCNTALPRCSRVAARALPFVDVSIQPVVQEGQPTVFPAASGVYAIYDDAEALQYVGISRTLSMSIAKHAELLGAQASAAKVDVLENATKDVLTDAWKQWLQEAVEATGGIPPGNASGPEKAKWQPARPPPPRPEIKLTPGKGAEDLTMDIKDIVDMVVKKERIVAFIKGTRTQPQCGFSFQLLTTLNGMKADYQVVNVLDEFYNPGLRDAIKEYSAWPTIPQLYVEGEFVGGSDIVQEMATSGELAALIVKK